MDLSTKISPVPTETTVGQAPCVFCGKLIGHINDCLVSGDNCDGFMAGGVVNGEVRHFLYCTLPLCKERELAEKAGVGVKDCSCEGYRANDVLGDVCHVCKKPPCEPEPEKDEAGEDDRPKKRIRAVIVIDVDLAESEEFFLENAPFFVDSRLTGTRRKDGSDPYTFLGGANAPVIFASVDDFLDDFNEGQIHRNPDANY